MNLPKFPRRIRAKLKHDRGLEKLKPKRPLNLSKITKTRVTVRGGTADSTLVYPEVFTDKWYPLVVDGRCLATRVSTMTGFLSEMLVDSLRLDWKKWLEKWMEKNSPKASFEEESKKAVKKIKKAKKKAGATPLVPDAGLPELVEEVGIVRAAKILKMTRHEVSQLYKKLRGVPEPTVDRSSEEDQMLQPLLPDS